MEEKKKQLWLELVESVDGLRRKTRVILVMSTAGEFICFTLSRKKSAQTPTDALKSSVLTNIHAIFFRIYLCTK